MDNELLKYELDVWILTKNVLMNIRGFALDIRYWEVQRGPCMAGKLWWGIHQVFSFFINSINHHF